MAKQRTMGKAKKPAEVVTSREFGMAWDVFKDAAEGGAVTDDLLGFGHTVLALLFGKYVKSDAATLFLRVPREHPEREIARRHHGFMTNLCSSIRFSLALGGKNAMTPGYMAKTYAEIDPHTWRDSFGAISLHVLPAEGNP